MNFKSAYKSANDNIHGDTQLIEKIFENSKKKTVHKINYYALTSVAAAVVLCCGLYASQYFVPHTGSSDNSVEKTRSIRLAEATPEQTPANSKKSRMAENDAVAFTENAVNDAIKEETILLNQDEYVEYLGVSLDDITLPLPAGMKWSFPEQYSILKDVSTGKVINDVNSIVALDESAPERIISLSVTKNGDEITSIMKGREDEIHSVSKGRVLIEKGELNICAYIEYDGLYLTLTSAGVTSEEFDTLLENIL